MSKKMIYEFTAIQEKQMQKIRKIGILNDRDVSNKEKIITLALELATKQISK